MVFIILQNDVRYGLGDLVMSLKLQKNDDFIIQGKYRYGIERSVNYSFLTPRNFCFIIEPKSYHESPLDPNWVKAMNEKMEALYQNQTWEIVNLPPNRKPIECKWVLKLNTSLMVK